MRPAEREPRDWLLATTVSAVLHLALLWLGQAGLDAEPRAPGAGVGPVGEFEVIALSPRAAEALLARRGAPSVATLAEAGGAGRPTPRAEARAAARPPGAPGPAFGGGPSAAAAEGAGALRAAPRTPTAPSGLLSAPEALPAPPSPAAGSLLDPSASELARAAERQGPGADGVADPAGSAGLEPVDAGAADGDAARGADVGLADDLVLQTVVPDYPSVLAKRDSLAGVRQRTGRLGVVVDGSRRAAAGGVLADEVWVIESTGDDELDRRCLRVLRRWRFDADRMRARGVLGRALWVDVEARVPER